MSRDTRDWQKDMEIAIEQEEKVKEVEQIVQSYYGGEYMPVTPASWYLERFSMLLGVLTQYKKAFERSYQRNVDANAKISEHIANTAAEKERADKSRELLLDALGTLVMYVGIKNEHVKRVKDGIRALYPLDKEEEEIISSNEGKLSNEKSKIVSQAIKAAFEEEETLEKQIRDSR